jgi:hypothetical protein
MLGSRDPRLLLLGKEALMTQTLDQKAAESSPETDLVAATLRVLAESSGPLTVSKIRAKLQAPFRSASLEELTDTLQRQVAASVLYQYPKYRSQQDRFWDRPMEEHLANLLRETLQEGPLGWTELRRKLPAYAVDPLTRAEAVLTDLLSRGALYRHPRTGKRGGDRFGLQPPDAKDYLRLELSEVFLDLQQLGFTEAQLRAAALELLHDEEWSPSQPQTSPPPQAEATEASAEAPAPAQEELFPEGAQTS